MRRLKRGRARRHAWHPCHDLLGDANSFVTPAHAVEGDGLIGARRRGLVVVLVDTREQVGGGAKVVQVAFRARLDAAAASSMMLTLLSHQKVPSLERMPVSS